MKPARAIKTCLAKLRKRPVQGPSRILALCLVLLGQTARAQDCDMMLSWSNKGQSVRNTQCEYVPVPPLDGTDWIRGTLSEKYEYRIDARFEISADSIINYIGEICEIGGKPFAIAEAKALEATNTRSVFFSCLSTPNEVQQ